MSRTVITLLFAALLCVAPVSAARNLDGQIKLTLEKATKEVKAAVAKAAIEQAPFKDFKQCAALNTLDIPKSNALTVDGAKNDFGCNMCNQLADQALQNMINIFMQVGIIGGCSGICSQVPGPAWVPEVCDLACTIVGVEEFGRILSSVDLDTYYFCELVKLCEVTDGGAADLANFVVNPAAGRRGETFEIDFSITVTNKTGTGMVVVEIVTPDGMPLGSADTHGAFDPGNYGFKWNLDTSQASEDVPWEPGTYKVLAAFCQGECGSKHPHSEVYVQGQTSFDIQ